MQYVGSVTFVAAEDIHAGDLVEVGQDGKVRPCKDYSLAERLVEHQQETNRILRETFPQSKE